MVLVSVNAFLISWAALIEKCGVIKHANASALLQLPDAPKAKNGTVINVNANAQLQLFANNQKPGTVIDVCANAYLPRKAVLKARTGTRMHANVNALQLRIALLKNQ